MAKTSPTSRTLNLLRTKGYTCQVVEKFNAWVKIRIDLFNFIDICAIKSGENGVLGIQATSGSNTSARIKKIKDNPTAKLWLETGNQIWVIGWRKLVKSKDGKFWQPKIEKITLENW